ncbi:MAG TPA: hypothetical protein VNR65_05880 [Geobacterales bacterium]|nr:hypothetical protein [Geobacterales bacterium]
MKVEFTCPLDFFAFFFATFLPDFFFASPVPGFRALAALFFADDFLTVYFADFLLAFLATFFADVFGAFFEVDFFRRGAATMASRHQRPSRLQRSASRQRLFTRFLGLCLHRVLQSFGGSGSLCLR